MKIPGAAKWARPGARDRRALAVGSALLGAALGVRLALLPYVHTLADIRMRVERERDLLRRERTLLAEVKRYPERMPAAERALLAEAPRLFGGPDLATASATLVNYVSTMALRHRVFVQQSASRVPATIAPDVVRLQVELRAVGDLEGILAFMQDLEVGRKLLTVESLTLGRAERLSVGGAPSDEEVLAMSATVSAYALGEVEMGRDTLAVVAAAGMR